MARVSYVDEDDVPEEYQDLLISALQGKPVHAYRSFGNNPEVLYGVRQLFSALWSDTGLSSRERELVVLVVAKKLRAEYEWHSHVKIAQGIDVPHEQVLSREEILALADDEYDGFSETEQLLIEYTHAVLDGAVHDGLHARMAEVYDDSTIVGACVLAGTYAMVARFFDAIDIDTDGEFHGWHLENI